MSCPHEKLFLASALSLLIYARKYVLELFISLYRFLVLLFRIIKMDHKEN